MAKVTIGDVAREAGVALGTVSNALNHPERVRPETLAIVNDAIRRLGYAPNQSARLLAGGHSKTFGLVLPQLNHGLSLQIASGASTEAQRQGYSLLIATANGDEALESSYTRYFAGTQMSGVLVQASSADLTRIAPTASRVPLAVLDAVCDGAGHYVSVDCAAQGSLIAEHAVSLGATRIAVIGRTMTPQTTRRLEGIRAYMELHPDVALDIVDHGEITQAPDGFMIGRHLATQQGAARPNFIIGLTDVLACGALEGVRAAGLRVPDDIAIAGCDGNPLAWSCSVPLTTCSPTGYELGRRGVRSLIDQIEARRAGTEDASENHQELVRPFMLTRASTVGRSAMQASDATGLNLGTFL